MKNIKIQGFTDFELTDVRMAEVLGGIGGPYIEISNPFANGWCSATANCSDGSTVTCTARNGNCSAQDYAVGEFGSPGGVYCWDIRGGDTRISC